MTLDLAKIKSDAEIIASRCDTLLMPLPVGDVLGMLARIADDERKLDALLNHCEDGECVTCGQIICAHGDGMHFHHDGCPSCAQDEGEKQ